MLKSSDQTTVHQSQDLREDGANDSLHNWKDKSLKPSRDQIDNPSIVFSASAHTPSVQDPTKSAAGSVLTPS
jgi:hypothetical protein